MKKKKVATTRTRTEAETQLAKLYAKYAELMRIVESKNVSKSFAKERPTKLSAEQAKAAAIAKMKAMGGIIKKQEDTVTKYKKRAALNPRRRVGGRTEPVLKIAQYGDRSASAISASRARLYGNFHKETGDQHPSKEDATVFVGGLSQEIDKDMLSSAFERFGSISDVRIVWGKGFGFITFDDRSAADRSISEMHRTNLHDCQISVSYSKKSNKSESKTTANETNPSSESATTESATSGGRRQMVYDDLDDDF